MGKRKIIRKSNRPLTFNTPNYYSWGGDFKNALGGLGGFDLKSTFSGANVANMLKGGLASGIGSAVGNIGGGLIGGGLQSGAGSAISDIGSTIGGAVGFVNPVMGGIISAGSGIIGGLTNRVFGSKLNRENINKIEGSIKGMNTLMVDSSSNDSVMNQWANQDFGSNFSKSDIGKDGLFSHKAKKKYRALKKQQGIARSRALTAFDNAAEAADMNTDLNAAANFAAYGGLLDILSGSSGAIGYELANKDLNIKATNVANKSRLTSLPNSFNAPELNTFAFGGDMTTNGADWDNGYTIIGNGGTHEENPMEGVPMGMDQNGTPNLVEEGEVVYNDYVFSNRLMVPNAIRQKYKLRGKKDMTFADAAKYMQKESKERPNDPISKRGLQDSMIKLQQAQEMIRQSKNTGNKKSFGGGLKSLATSLFGSAFDNYRLAKGNLEFGMFGAPNPYAHGGKMGILFDGTGPYPNALFNEEQPQTYWGYIDMLNPSNAVVPYAPTEQDTRNLNKFISFWEAANEAGYTGTPLWKGAKDILGIKNEPKAPLYVSSTGTVLNPVVTRSATTKVDNKDTEDKGNKKSDLTRLRYAPVVGAAIGLGQNLFSRPDYTSADAILEAANQAGNYTPVEYTPIGNYLKYRPFDRNFYLNKLNAQAGATRRAIMNTTSPSRNAALLAADYNAQGRLGDLARQAEEYNLAQRQAVETFNRGTNQANAEMGLKAAMANQEAALKARSSRLSGVAQAMGIRDSIDGRRAASMSANLTNFFNSLGDIGREEYSRNMIISNPALYYSIDNKGNVSYKNGYENLSEAEKKEVRNAANKAKKKKAKGGYLTIKKK